MSRPDTGNAHVRKGSKGKRQDPDVLAGEAEQLLENPAFQRAYDAVRDGCIKILEDMQHDGSPEMVDQELEICRTLRTLKSVRRNLSLAVQRRELKLVKRGNNE